MFLHLFSGSGEPNIFAENLSSEAIGDRIALYVTPFAVAAAKYWNGDPFQYWQVLIQFLLLWLFKIFSQLSREVIMESLFGFSAKPVFVNVSISITVVGFVLCMAVHVVLALLTSDGSSRWWLAQAIFPNSLLFFESSESLNDAIISANNSSVTQ